VSVGFFDEICMFLWGRDFGGGTLGTLVLDPVTLSSTGDEIGVVVFFFFFSIAHSSVFFCRTRTEEELCFGILEAVYLSI